jgi:GTP-binding protein
MMENSEKAVPTVAIVGRPNVGKSSLLNALIGKRASIVHHESGVTRDRIVVACRHKGREFQLIDTGGIASFSGVSKQATIWDHAIREQATAAVESAELLLFTTDVQAGITSLDEEIAEFLRSSGKPVLIVANKSDNPSLELASLEFASLGFPDVLPVSCQHRLGIDTLLGRIVCTIPDAPESEEQEQQPFRVAVVGRPNVGKSSFINQLIGKKRVLVSDVAGTTRDAVDISATFEYENETVPFVLVDTAGLRKRAKVDNTVETFSMSRTRWAISAADLVVLLLEASASGVTAQDRKIAQLIQDAAKACVIVANKWDLCKEHGRKEVEQEIRRTMPFMDYAPIVFASSLTGENVKGVLTRIFEARSQMRLHIPTALLNQVVGTAVRKSAPPVDSSGRPLKVYYATMKKGTPPTFLLFVNEPSLCPPHYLNYLENSFRKAFSYVGLPVVIQMRRRPRKSD